MLIWNKKHPPWQIKIYFFNPLAIWSALTVWSPWTQLSNFVYIWKLFKEKLFNPARRIHCQTFHKILLSPLSLPMLSLLLSKALGCKDFWKPSKPYHVGIHWITPTEYCQMSSHVPGFLSFFRVYCMIFY